MSEIDTVSEVTAQCLDLLVKVLDNLYDCLAADERIKEEDVKPAFADLVRQACDQAQPVEERMYRIVRTDE